MKCYIISLGIGLNMFFPEFKKMVCGEEVATYKNWSEAKQASFRINNLRKGK